MGKIRVLSEEVANRIAAGEVIERPVSVVKELVENAIDAEATEITVAIENGGKKSIVVSDNGCGMREDDAMQAFERHATSKIHTVTDIFNINTLGFRGEAMPSIASVSLMTLITRDKDSSVATQIEFDSGKLINFTKTSANYGTTISVRKLFANIPARKKFLKSDQVEFKHIMSYLHYQAVLYPNIHFRFISNNREKLNYPAVEDIEKRMLAIFGSDFLKRDLIKIESRKPGFELHGYISGLEEDSEFLSDFRYLFVNGRFIKDKIIFHSIKAAYEPFIKKLRIFQQGKTPPYILFLNVEPNQVDFNVHPAKLELRFGDPGRVHSFVKNAISKKLMNYEDQKFSQLKNRLTAEIKSGKATEFEAKIFNNKTDKKRFSNYKKEFENAFQPDIFNQPTVEDEEISKKIAPTKPEMIIRSEADIINPWQLHQSYIFVQVEEGLMMIDQHAAHERIIYEKILHRIHGAPASTQKLLFPIVLDLPPYLKHTIPQLIQENLEIFNKIGFSVKTFSGDSVVIDEIPAELENWDGGAVFIDILKQLEDEFEETEDFRDSLSKSVACKAAIKAGQKMSKKEMISLINDLFACEVPYFCPHGRPLILKFTMEYFEKKFKRIET
jgi:DNA mismatch repair protein MutL